MALWENIPQQTRDNIIKSLNKFDRRNKRKQKIKGLIDVVGNKIKR